MPGTSQIDPSIPPSGTGCWNASRRTGGGTTSAGARTAATSAAANVAIAARPPACRRRQHPIVRSFEPDEDWFYDFVSDQ